jgi:hypothetical protein
MSLSRGFWSTIGRHLANEVRASAPFHVTRVA